MSKASMHSFKLGRARLFTPMIDKSTIIPILACVYSIIVSPLLIFLTAGAHNPLTGTFETRHENKLFWPAMAAISVVLVVRHRPRIGTFRLHIICLLAYLAFAGASVLWAFRPELSFIRYAQQVMVVTSIVLPAMLAVRKSDMMRALFLCLAFASILNLFFVLGGSQTIVNKSAIGYSGYFEGKNYLGEFAAVALLLSLHETRYRGLRRVLGSIVVTAAASLVILSNSKTALGLAIFAPFLAGVTLFISRTIRVSPAIVLLSIPLSYAVFSNLSSTDIFGRISYILYGDSTLTGRTIIWDFAKYEIARRPLFGWGYQSFWLVGPDGPSIVDAPGWVKTMPNAHNGYYDTMLEIGYVGLALLVIFIIATLHAVRRMAYHDPARAWLVLSLALFIIIHNFLESTWMRGFEFLWVVFLMLVAEIARYGQPFPGGHPHAASAARHIAPHPRRAGRSSAQRFPPGASKSVPAHRRNRPFAS